MYRRTYTHIHIHTHTCMCMCIYIYTCKDICMLLSTCIAMYIWQSSLLTLSGFLGVRGSGRAKLDDLATVETKLLVVLAG